MKFTNHTQTNGRALDQTVYEFLVSKTNNNVVFEIKSYLVCGGVVERRPTSATTAALKFAAASSNVRTDNTVGVRKAA